jgi:outer membrane protein
VTAATGFDGSTMKRIVLHILALMALGVAPALSAQAPASDSLSLDSAIARVLATYPAVDQASRGVAAVQSRVAGSRSSYYPEVAVEGSYARVDPVPSFDFPGLGSFKLFPANNYDAHLAVRQTVFDFGKRATEVAFSESLGQAADHNVELVRAGLAFETIRTFYSILYLERNLDVQDEQIAALTRHLEVTREKVRTGSATDFDVLTTQVRVATAQSQRVDVANTLERERVRLRGLLGLPPDAPLHLAGTFDIAAPTLRTDSLVALALTQRPELKLSRDAEATAGIQTRLASLGDRPSVKVGVTAGVKNGYVPNLNEATANWNAGIQVDVPVFNGFRRSSHVAEAQLNFQAAQDHTRDIERRVATDVQQAIADVQASEQQLSTSELQVTQAEQAVSLAEVRYDAGVITNLDVLDAQTSLEAARLVALKARYDFVRSRYELDRALGNHVW